MQLIYITVKLRCLACRGQKYAIKTSTLEMQNNVVRMQNNYLNMRLIHVNMQHNYVCMKLTYVYIYVDRGDGAVG